MSYFPHAPAAYGHSPSVVPPPPLTASVSPGVNHHQHHQHQHSSKVPPENGLPFFCSEVYFSAWYNAHMNGKLQEHKAASQKALPPTLDELPTMLSKGQVIDGRKSAGTPIASGGVGGPLASKKSNTKLHHMASLQAAHLDSLTSSPAKSMPIHCIVEQTVCGSAEKTTTEVDMDTYAILPSSTLFNEIIRVAMTKLGYSVVEAMGAKGAIQIRNWKPLTFDTITDFPDATVEEILGDLTSIATLRIRLCSRSKLNALEDVKEKLLQFLVQHSQSMLQSVGCPIEKGTLSRICKGDYPLNLPDDTRQAFERWYKDQTMKREPLSGEQRPPKEARYETGGGGAGAGGGGGGGGGQHAAHHQHHHHHHHGLPSSYPTLRGELNLSMNNSGGGGGGGGPYVPKPRIRTSFDPEHEIPRLHRWFQQNQHPSREQMVLYLNELNSLELRRGRKPLDLTNIIYWFKNARAAQRRANRSSDLLSEDPCMDVEQDSMDDHDGEQEAEADRLSPVSSESVPVLPNKNAVYVVSSPLHHGPQTTTACSRSNSPVIHIIPQDPNDLANSGAAAAAAAAAAAGGTDPRNCSSSSGGVHNSEHGAPPPPQPAPVPLDPRPPSAASSTGLNNNLKGGELVVVENGQGSTHSDSELDEPMDYVDSRTNGHDFSRQRSASVDSRSSHNGGGSNSSGEKRDGLDSSGSGQSSLDLESQRDHHRLDIKQEMEHNRESDYPSSSAAATPSPQQQHMLGLPATPQPPPAHQSHAMAMAALPHPINFHYMHSAAAAHALYGGLDSPLLNSHSHFKESPPMSAEERKKRSRVFIDPLTEIPKLEKWFAEDTHPSSYMIEKYTEEMNRSEYRQRFPRLEPKNVQLWFKNHRAKVKRGRLEQQATPISMASV